VEAADYLHHTYRFRERAEEIVVGKSILLQEVLANNTRDLKRNFLIFGQRVLADQLHNLLQVILLLQDLLHRLLKCAILGVIGFEVRLQDTDVLREGDVPIHRWEMLTLRKLLVKAPEDLHNAKGRGCYGISEIAAWW
jgi:hypothetical protein